MAYQPVPNRAVNMIQNLMDFIDKANNIVVSSVSSNYTNIPSAACVRETAVLNNNINDVWNVLKSATFDFSSAVKSTKIADKSSSEVGNTRIINYNDGTSQTIQIMEISFLSHCVAYCVVSSTPSVSYSSANHEIKLTEVTVSNETFIEWSTDFSNDASLQVIRDSRFKKKEAFRDLRDYLSKQFNFKQPIAKVDNKDVDVDEKKEELLLLLIVEVEKTTDVDIDELWKIVSDFGNVSYSKLVEKCLMSDEGQVRNITIKNNGGELSDRIERVNKNEYTLAYTLIKNTALPVTNYNSVVKLTKVDAGAGCKINWTSKFNSKEVSDSLAEATIREVLESSVEDIIAFAKK